MQDAGQLSSVSSAPVVGCRSWNVATTVRQARCVRTRARASLTLHDSETSCWVLASFFPPLPMRSRCSLPPPGYSYASNVVRPRGESFAHRIGSKSIFIESRHLPMQNTLVLEMAPCLHIRAEASAVP